VAYVVPMNNTNKNEIGNLIVADNCYGIELLTIQQRNLVKDFNSIGFILENVTLSGVAMLEKMNGNGFCEIIVYPCGSFLRTKIFNNK